MLSTLTLITLSSTLFFILLLLFLSWRRRKSYLLCLEGAQAMVKKTKKLKTKRQEQFKEICALSDIDESKIDGLWISELEFYQHIGETLCAPSEKSIKKVTFQVTKLLTPYYELLSELAKNSIPDELNNVIDSAESPPDLNSLEKKYKEKVSENEKLQKKLSNLKKSSGSGSNNTDELDSLDFIELLNKIIIDLSEKAEMPLPTKNTADLEELKITYEATLLKLDEKINAFDSANDEFDQNEALIEQLRHEKVDYLKKYKRSMTLLFNTYKEYAGAFGLEAPENPDIEIDDFEKFIEDS